MIVVTGASGNVGSHLAETLAAQGEQVRAVARGLTHPLRDKENVTAVTGDLEDPQSLAGALEGADALFLLLPGAGAGVDVPRLLELAAAGGVTRTVLLSSQAAGTRRTSSSHAPMAAIEGQLKSSGMAWTILRPGGFHSNVMAWAQTIREHRTVYAPFGDIGLPSIDPADIAEVAAVALSEVGHDEKVYVLTGPEVTTPRQRAAAIGDAVGSPLTFVDLSREQARDQMVQFMPPPVADGTLDILGDPTAEETAVSPDVADVLGKPGRTFADWAARHAAVFA